MARKSKKPASRGSVNNIILEVLSTGKKYGYEIIKEVEKKTNGKIKLKQPSLYSSLSRFEEKNYLSSFWQDSDIGGKRHYYELTPLGFEAYRKLTSKEDDEDIDLDYQPETVNNSNISEESSLSNNESIFKIDEDDYDENDIFNNSTEIKLKNYSNFDVSERLNELLNEITKNDNNINQATPSNLNEDKGNSVLNQNINPETNFANNDSDSEPIDCEIYEEDESQILSNQTPTQSIDYDINNDINIVKQTSPFENQNGENLSIKQNQNESLLNNQLTNSINELDREIEKIKNEESSSKRNDLFESAEFQQSLKKIYNNIKNYDATEKDSIGNDMSSVPLSFLEAQRRKASMDILYGNAQNYYYPSQEQNSISQKEEQINFEEFIKLKQDLNNRKSVYNLSTIFHKKPKPYILQNLYTTKNNKHIDENKSTSESGEKKLKYTFDEFGIMKIYNEDSNKNKKKSQIVDNVGYRAEKPYSNMNFEQNNQTKNENITQIKKQNFKQKQEIELSEEEIERKNKNFKDLFNKILEEKMVQSPNNLQEQERISHESSDNLNEVVSDVNLEDDNFVDFDNSSKSNNPSQNSYQENSFPDEKPQRNIFSNIKIKTYGEVSSFNEESNKYIAINKLKALLGFSMCILNIILTTVLLILLKNQGLINNSNLIFYKLSYILSAVVFILNLFPYFINKNKRIEDKFNFNYSIMFSSLSFALALIVTYALNTLFGFNFSNFTQFSTSLLIPFIWGLNILFIPVIYKLILKANFIRK